MDIQEQKRAKEWEEREEKIKKAMGRMADTVGKQNLEKEKKDDKRFMQYALEKDRKEIEKENQKKVAVVERDKEVRKALAF